MFRDLSRFGSLVLLLLSRSLSLVRFGLSVCHSVKCEKIHKCWLWRVENVVMYACAGRAYMDFCIRRDIGTKLSGNCHCLIVLCMWIFSFVVFRTRFPGNITHITRKIIVWAVTTLHKSSHRPTTTTIMCAGWFFFTCIITLLLLFWHLISIQIGIRQATREQKNEQIYAHGIECEVHA